MTVDIPSATAIVVAAGGARRMGFDKLTAPLGGLPVLVRTVRAFVDSPHIQQVVVVTTEERWALLQEYGLGSNCEFVLGGAERHLSVAQGLAMATGDLVAVQDGARPLVTADLILNTLQAAHLHGAAAVGRRIADTLKKVDSALQVQASVDREGLWAMETPQAFSTDLLRRAYAAVLTAGQVVTDEVSAIQLLGHPVQMVEAKQGNMKITFPEDFALAELLLSVPK